MSKIAAFPGSFDPFTVGHQSIVLRALPLFDKIVIGIGRNTSKDGYFALEKRIAWIQNSFAGNEKVLVEIYDGLTVDFCKRIGAKFILRGLRTSADFEYERAIGQINRAMNPEIENVYLLTLPEHTAISSTIVREIAKHGGDVSQFVPKGMDLSS